MNTKSLGVLGAIALLAIGAFTGLDVNSLLNGGGTPNADQRSTSAPQSSLGQTQASYEARGTGFDYYVLALSWSPTFCLSNSDNNSRQCSGQRDYGFVVHGLWPQFEKGYPSNCDVRARVDDRIVDDMLPIMPAKGLIYHQWKKHGTCSGMRPAEYFETVQDAYRTITIPEPLRKLPKLLQIKPSVIEDAFLEANSKLDADEIVINCSKNRLREIRICLTKDLTPRACGRDVHRECRDDVIRMPPVR